MPSRLMSFAAALAAFFAVSQLLSLRYLERGSPAAMRSRGAIANAMAFAGFMVVGQQALPGAWNRGLLAAAFALLTWSIVVTISAILRGRRSHDLGRNNTLPRDHVP